MRYIDVEWIHGFPDEPTRLVSELDDEGFEVRKIEVYMDGRVAFASRFEARSQGTEVSYVVVPPLSEINQDPQFRGRSLSREEFEALWVTYATQGAA